MPVGPEGALEWRARNFFGALDRHPRLTCAPTMATFRRWLLPCLGVAALGIAPASRADERFDHRGSIGLLVGAGGEYGSAAIGQGVVQGFRLDGDLGATLAVGVDGNEVLALARGTFLGPRPDWSLTLGYRGYFGQERLKTFFDLGAALHSMSALSAGPRLGFGLQYELSPVAGFYAGIAAQIGFGQAIRFDGEVVAGLQLRSYLFE